jgi:osmotically-inducible protein OsmY
MAKAAASEVTQRAQSALLTSPIRVLHDVRVDQDGETLVLSGHVQSFYQKQLAQELVRTVAAECELINSIHVQ